MSLLSYNSADTSLKVRSIDNEVWQLQTSLHPGKLNVLHCLNEVNVTFVSIVIFLTGKTPTRILSILQLSIALPYI